MRKPKRFVLRGSIYTKNLNWVLPEPQFFIETLFPRSLVSKLWRVT